MNYHMAIDIWSLGCILAELYTGFPIFPGENEQEQLSCIMEVLGVPDKDFVNKSSRKRIFFGKRLRSLDIWIHADERTRQSWWSKTGCQFQRQTTPPWNKNARTSSAMQRRGLCRLHCKMSDVGSREANQAPDRNAPPFHHWKSPYQGRQPLASQSSAFVVKPLQQSNQATAGDSKEVADQRPDSSDCAHVTDLHINRGAIDA